MVLKDDLHKVTEGRIHDIGCHDDLVCNFSSGFILNCVIFEDLVPNSIVLSKLKWSGRVSVGYTVDCITKLTIHSASRVDELDGAGNVNGTIMVGALRIRPSCTGCEVPTEGSELIE